MPAEPRPVSRRERPAKPALSRDGIVDAAMAVIAADGLERLTMRRLAADLDTGPASLYVYVRNMTELHALVIDRLLAELDVEWEDAAPWRPRLHRLLGDYIGLLMRHPSLARSALTTWPDGPHYLDVVELLLALLDSAGVDGRRASWGMDLLLQFATASAVEWSTREEADEQDVADLARTLGTATPERHPRVSAVGAEAMVAGDHGARLAWFIDAVVNGVLATPVPEDGSDDGPDDGGRTPG